MNQPYDDRFEPMDDQFHPVGSDKIREVESSLETNLPEEYVAFLSRYGGCGFSGDANVVFDGGELPIFTFFDDQKLISNLHVYDDLAAERKFAIADDMSGNPYVIDTSTGSIHFIDFSVNPPIGIKVAESFERLLNSIEVIPD